MNTALLRAKIVEKEMTIEGFCEKYGFSRATFARKLKGETEFNRSEMEVITRALDLTSSEMGRIFFPDLVA